MAYLPDLRRRRVRYAGDDAGDGGAEGGEKAGGGGGDLGVFEGGGIGRVDGGIEAVGYRVIVMLDSG